METKMINLDSYPCKPTSQKEINKIIESIEKYSDETKRNIDWIECEYCGFRVSSEIFTTIHSHIYKKHRAYVLEVRKNTEEKEIYELTEKNKLDQFVCYSNKLDQLRVINESIEKHKDESKRDIDWVECPYCGFRATSLISHIPRIHKEYIHTNGEIACKQVIYSVSSTFLSWLNKNPKYKTLTEPEQRIHFKQWMLDHNMIGDISGDKNPNHKSKTTEEQRRSVSPKCIEFYEQRYPNLSHDERLKMLDDHSKNIHKKLNENDGYQTKLSYWLKVHNGDVDKAKESLKQRQGTKRMQRFIDRYGEEDGKRRFNEMNKKWFKSISSVFKCGSSKIEREFVDWLFNEFDELNNEDRFNIKTYKNHQASITFTTEAGKINKYRPDILINNKFIIDFFGDYTHGNNLIYPDDMIIRFGNIGWTVKQKNDFDQKRKYILKQKGYNILVIWEHDFLHNIESVKQQIKQFLYL